MSIKTYKPVTPSLRHMIKIVKPAKQKAPRELIEGRINRTGGRNNSGRITIRHRGGGHKQRYRKIDRERQIGEMMEATVESIEYNPSSSGHLCLLTNNKGVK